MPPASQNQIPTPEQAALKPEGKTATSGSEELQNTPEVAAPQSAEKRVTEQFNDQQSQLQQQIAQAPQNVPAQDDQVTSQPASDPQQEDVKVPEMDGAWVTAADAVIEKDKNLPYEEEEDAEDLQVKYLKQRFGKEIKKNEE